MDYTTNYNLNKPSKSQMGWDVLINDNFDKIDGEIKKTNDKIGDVNNLDKINVICKYSTTPPIDNADFIGQIYIDILNRVGYIAVNTGTGTSDWKQITL